MFPSRCCLRLVFSLSSSLCFGFVTFILLYIYIVLFSIPILFRVSSLFQDRVESQSIQYECSFLILFVLFSSLLCLYITTKQRVNILTNNNNSQQWPLHSSSSLLSPIEKNFLKMKKKAAHI
jgi:hypothetical protein